MCYKAGPRCPSVALLAIEKAEHKWATASNIAQRNDAMQEIMDAKHQYDLTVKGQKDIESLIETAKLQGETGEVSRLKYRLETAKQERKELLTKAGVKDTDKDAKHSYAIPTAKENPSVRTARLMDMIKIETASLQTAEGWKGHLDIASRFPTLAFDNQIILKAQDPDATHINTYEDWAKEGRAVSHSSQAIYLLTPTITHVKEKNPHTGASETVEKITGFRSVGTFDIGNTVGKETAKKANSVSSFNTHIANKLNAYGYAVETVDPSKMNGRDTLTDVKQKVVYVNNHSTPEEIASGLSYEISNIGLGHDKKNATTSQEANKRVFEAKSLAYIMKKTAGIESKDDFSVVEKFSTKNSAVYSAQRVSKAAKFLLNP